MCGLEDVPEDVFIRICYFLPAIDIISLRLACKTFRSWTGIRFWRKRLSSLCPGNFPCLKEKKLDCINETISREMFLSVFGANGNMCHFMRSYSTSFAIDAIHIPAISPNLLLTGDRGRIISIFDLNELEQSKDTWNPISVESRFHSGWIWSIQSSGHCVISGSWDKTLRLWSLAPTGILPISLCQLPGPIFSTRFVDPHTVLVASNAFVHTIDLRAQVTNHHGPRLKHKGFVLCLESPGRLETLSNQCDSLPFNCSPGGDHLSSVATSLSELSSLTTSEDNLLDMCNNTLEPELLFASTHVSLETSDLENIYEIGDQSLSSLRSTTKETLQTSDSNISSGQTFNVITGCYDHNISGWDLRFPSEPIRTLELPGYPRRMSLIDEDELWVAQPPNSLHIIDIRNSCMNHVQTYQLPGWNRGFGDLVCTKGCVFVSGLHGTVEVLHPTFPPSRMGGSPLAESMRSAPNALTVHKNLLAVGCEDGTIHIWTEPKRNSLSG